MGKEDIKKKLLRSMNFAGRTTRWEIFRLIK